MRSARSSASDFSGLSSYSWQPAEQEREEREHEVETEDGCAVEDVVSSHRAPDAAREFLRREAAQTQKDFERGIHERRLNKARRARQPLTVTRPAAGA